MRILRLLGRALRLRCPNCGSRGIVHPWARLVPRCPGCDHRFEREEGYWLGAVLLNTVVAVGLFATIFIVWATAAWPDVPWTTILVVTMGVNIVFPILFHPFARTLWVALDLAVHPVPPEPG